MQYQERFYRELTRPKFGFEVSYKESDLYVSADRLVDKGAVREVLTQRYTEIEEYVKVNPLFLVSLSPVERDQSAPAIVQDMIECSYITGIGPFASVAGAVAMYVGREVLKYADEVIVENGGDIFLKINGDKAIGVYLGDSFPSPNMTLKVRKRDEPFGIASSSATMGPSLNFGRADLVTVLAKNPVVADGFATALSNRVRSADDVKGVVDTAKREPLIEGILVAVDGKVFMWGDFEIEDR